MSEDRFDPDEGDAVVFMGFAIPVIGQLLAWEVDGQGDQVARVRIYDEQGPEKPDRQSGMHKVFAMPGMLRSPLVTAHRFAGGLRSGRCWGCRREPGDALHTHGRLW